MDQARPGAPEWVAMLLSVAPHERIGPAMGWYMKAVATSRYQNPSTWMAGARDSSSPADFMRLDRDQDGVITAHARHREFRFLRKQEIRETLKEHFRIDTKSNEARYYQFPRSNFKAPHTFRISMIARSGEK
jgi:hypothetical protein